MYKYIRIPLRIIERTNTNASGYSNTKVPKCPSTSCKLGLLSAALNLDVKNDRRITYFVLHHVTGWIIFEKLIKVLEVSIFNHTASPIFKISQYFTI